jgi:hypothetical protein
MTPGHQFMNDAIRHAARRGQRPVPDVDAPRAIADLGIGKGAGARGLEHQPPPSFSSVLRAARQEGRERIHERAVYLDHAGRPWAG